MRAFSRLLFALVAAAVLAYPLPAAAQTPGQDDAPAPAEADPIADFVAYVTGMAEGGGLPGQVYQQPVGAVLGWLNDVRQIDFTGALRDALGNPSPEEFERGLGRVSKGIAVGAVCVAFPPACAVTGAGISLGLLMAWLNEASAAEQGLRPAVPGTYPLRFSGVASAGGNAVSYTGVRTGSTISGTYQGSGGAGQFSGTLSRNQTVTGRYSEAGEAGSFRGTITPDLGRVIGETVCTSQCD